MQNHERKANGVGVDQNSLIRVGLVEKEVAEFGGAMRLEDHAERHLVNEIIEKLIVHV